MYFKDDVDFYASLSGSVIQIQIDCLSKEMFQALELLLLECMSKESKKSLQSRVFRGAKSLQNTLHCICLITCHISAKKQ